MPGHNGLIVGKNTLRRSGAIVSEVLPLENRLEPGTFDDVAIPFRSICGGIRILVIDQMRLMANLVVSALTADSRFEPFMFDGKVPLADQLKAIDPDIALISAHSSAANATAIEMVHLTRSLAPQVRIVVLLGPSDDVLVVEAFRAGAQGVFCSDDSVESLKQCLQSVHQGEIWARNSQLLHLVQVLVRSSPPVAARADSNMPVLTKRETDIVRGVADGLTNRDIALRLELSEHTVKNYLFRLFDRLGVSNRAELVACALGSR
jgi:DNA-binding NarL/FixJ family response regulator